LSADLVEGLLAAQDGAESQAAFQAFNRATGMGAVRDPYPIFDALRSQGPVAVVETGAFLGAGATDLQIPPGMEGDIYVCLSHEAVSRVLRDADLFSSAGYAESMGVVMGRTILQMDPPEHGRYRDLIQRAFTKKAVEVWERELIEPVVKGLIDRFEARGQADLVRELTFPFPVAVIAGMMGLPVEEFPSFHRLAIELISVTTDFEGALRASRGL